MLVDDLNEKQLTELKQSYLSQLDNEGTLKEIVGLECLSWDDMAHADEIITDADIKAHYDGVEFSEDDFTSKATYKLADLSDATTTITEVECDDHGDDYWKYKAVWKLDGKEIYSDYYHDKPDAIRCYNTLLEAWKEDII